MAIAIVFVLSYLLSDNFSHFGLLFVNVVQNVPTILFVVQCKQNIQILHKSWQKIKVITLLEAFRIMTPFTLWYRFPKTFFHLYLAFLLGFYNFSGKLKLIAFSH